MKGVCRGGRQNSKKRKVYPKACSEGCNRAEDATSHGDTLRRPCASFMLCHPYIALAPGYRPGACSPFCGPIIVAGGCMPPLPLPPLGPPLPRPRPMPTPGMAKSGFAALASRITSSGLIGLPPPRPLLYGPKLPAAAPISGRHAGLTGRCDTDVKCEASLAAGLREPSGRSS